MDARALRLATAEAAITEGVKRENICKVTVSDHEPRFSLMGSSLLYDKTQAPLRRPHSLTAASACWINGTKPRPLSGGGNLESYRKL